VIAVFVAGIVLGIRRPDVRAYVATRSEDIVEIVKLGVFVVFGSLLTFRGLFDDGWAAVGIVIVTLLIARPVAIWTALAGTRTDTATKAFIAWFGPKGVATMTFSLLLLSEPIAQNNRIFNIAALVVFCSILAHGLTDQPGSEWIARRASRPIAGEPPDASASVGVTGDEACAGGTGETPGAANGAEAPADRPGAGDLRA
jgi:NhaP-type Na+/H+ and K+/H+ antiporter